MGSGSGIGGVHRHGGVHLPWKKKHWTDETDEEKELRRIASGLLPPKAEQAIQKATKRIADNKVITKALEQEFIRAMAAQIESKQLRMALWNYELRRIQDDEAAAVILLLH